MYFTQSYMQWEQQYLKVQKKQRDNNIYFLFFIFLFFIYLFFYYFL